MHTSENLPMDAAKKSASLTNCCTSKQQAENECHVSNQPSMRALCKVALRRMTPVNLQRMKVSQGELEGGFHGAIEKYTVDGRNPAITS